MDKNKPIVGEFYEGGGETRDYPVLDKLVPGTLVKIDASGYAVPTTAGEDLIYGIAGWGYSEDYTGKTQGIIIEGLVVSSVDPRTNTNVQSRVAFEQQVNAQLGDGQDILGYAIRVG